MSGMQLPGLFKLDYLIKTLHQTLSHDNLIQSVGRYHPPMKVLHPQSAPQLQVSSCQEILLANGRVVPLTRDSNGES